MREDYKIKGPVNKIEVDIEIEIAEKLALMSTHTRLSLSELTNTALKRFIVSHKDFLPAVESSESAPTAGTKTG